MCQRQPGLWLMERLLFYFIFILFLFSSFTFDRGTGFRFHNEYEPTHAFGRARTKTHTHTHTRSTTINCDVLIGEAAQMMDSPAPCIIQSVSCQKGSYMSNGSTVQQLNVYIKFVPGNCSEQLDRS